MGWSAYTFNVVGLGTNRLTFSSQTPGSAGSALDDVCLIAVPTLSIIPLGPHQATLSWPLWATNFGVEFSSALSPAEWLRLNSPVTTFSNRYEVVIDGLAGQSFYRLRK